MPTFQHSELLSEHEILHTRFPRLRKRRISAPIQRRSRLNMAWSYTRSNDWKYCCKLLILRSARVLAKDRGPEFPDAPAFLHPQCARRRRATFRRVGPYS